MDLGTPPEPGGELTSSFMKNVLQKSINMNYLCFLKNFQ